MTTVYLNLPLQTSFEICTDCDEIVDLIYLKFGSYADATPSSCTNQKISIRKGLDTYFFDTDNLSFTTNSPVTTIDKYSFENTVYDESILALHGAAVEYNGYCHLFLGATTSGKTTLTSYLTSNGFGYLTDDCILLDRSDFKIHPFSTPIHLREGGLEVLKRYNSAPKNIQKLEEPPALLRYLYTPDNCVHHPIPLKSIYFIRRTDDENRVADMPTTERITELLKSPITPYEITKEYLSFISRIAKSDCKRLFYSDMNFVKDVIING